MRHEHIETNSGLMILLILFVISIGGLVEIVPLFYINETVEKVDVVRPYTPLEMRGRDIYIREGCYLCHSQQIRPFRDEWLRYGHYSLAAESQYDHPFQWGSKRTGPDLARVFSLIGVCLALSPALGLMSGAWLDRLFGYHGVLASQLLMAALLLGWSWRGLPETRPATQATPAFGQVLHMPLVGVLAAHSGQIGTGSLGTPLKGMVVLRLRRQRVVTVTQPLVAKWPDHLRMA